MADVAYVLLTVALFVLLALVLGGGAAVSTVHPCLVTGPSASAEPA